jgi:hypothetical protein
LPGVKVVGLGINLGHGLGLDYGMLWIGTEYTLICDPDSVIVGERLWPELKRRVDLYGAASVDNGASFYHPVCLAFRTDTWKRKTVSLEQRWPDWDVAGGLTPAVGGLNEEALLPLTRHAGPPLESARPGHVHYYGEVYADAVSNTYGMARLVKEPDKADFEGWSRPDLVSYHARWTRWAAAVVEGQAKVADFPTS